jgi:5-methylcytosine-specific restriction endonuclease McrA
MEKFSIAWYQANPDYVKALNEIYDKKYPSHWHRKGSPDYYKVKVKAHKIRAEKLKRLPRWADEQAIEKVFRDAPDGLEIDHIIPLQGANVSGLHIASNLQYLTTKENGRKHNNFKPRRSIIYRAEISLI